MKKNLLGIVAAALAVVALIFGILSFVKTSKIGALEDQVALLEKNLGTVAEKLGVELDTSAEKGTVSFADREPFAVSFGSAQNYNLKTKGKYATMKGYTLYLDKNADDFKTVLEQLQADHAQIDGILSGVISSSSFDEATSEAISAEALKKINKLFGSNVAVQLILDGYVRQ